MIRSFVWHDSIIRVPWLDHTCTMTCPCAWHDAMVCVTWRGIMRDMPCFAVSVELGLPVVTGGLGFDSKKNQVERLNVEEAIRKILVYTLQHTATQCNTLPHTATHTATYCNMLQRTTTHFLRCGGGCPQCSIIYVYMNACACIAEPVRMKVCMYTYVHICMCVCMSRGGCHIHISKNTCAFLLARVEVNTRLIITGCLFPSVIYKSTCV